MMKKSEWIPGFIRERIKESKQLVDTARAKGWGPSIDDLYERYVETVAAHNAGGTVDEAMAIASVASVKSKKRKWETLYDTDFLRNEIRTWAETHGVSYNELLVAAKGTL
jgi:hypothetical protein